MNNAELIKALRWCGDETNDWCVRETYKCPLWDENRITDYCKAELMTAAADALEADEKRIAIVEEERDLERFAAKNYMDKIDELKAKLPKEGEWIGIEYDGYADGCPVYDVWECSECKEEHKGEEDTLPNYCPNCGARMRKGEDK